MVPLAEKALDALEGHPVRIDTTLLFATQEGHADRPAPLAVAALDTGRSKLPVSPTAARTR